MALSALALVRNATLDVVGDGDERAALAARASRLGLSERVRFHGFVGDVRPAIAAADVALSSARSEGLGIALLEAMAMGRAVVALPTGGISGNGTGVFFDAHPVGGTINGISLSCNAFEGNGTGVKISNVAGAGAQAHSNSFVANGLSLLNQDPDDQTNAENNWWGTNDGPAIAAMVSGNVDYTPWLGSTPVCSMPDNVLYLLPTPASIYIQPTETAVIDLNVANLLQPVTGLQAMLNFSSTYFKSGSGEVGVAPAGAPWRSDLQRWDAGGDFMVRLNQLPPIYQVPRRATTESHPDPEGPKDFPGYFPAGMDSDLGGGHPFFFNKSLAGRPASLQP